MSRSLYYFNFKWFGIWQHNTTQQEVNLMTDLSPITRVITHDNNNMAGSWSNNIFGLGSTKNIGKC